VPSGGAPWEDILPNNIVGTYNVYEAARQAGVPRLIYASSNHAAGFAVKESTPVGPDALRAPDGFSIAREGSEIVLRAVEMGVDVGRTLSCYDPGKGGRPCGEAQVAGRQHYALGRAGC